jgi:hypothetical protein
VHRDCGAGREGRTTLWGKSSCAYTTISPGSGLSLAPAGTAILTRSDGREFWLGVPFGTGAGLTFHEIALLVNRDNPYWDSERFALMQSAAAALAAAALAARFHRRGAALLSEPTPERGSDSGATSVGSAEAPVR